MKAILIIISVLAATGDASIPTVIEHESLTKCKRAAVLFTLNNAETITENKSNYFKFDGKFGTKWTAYCHTIGE